MDISYTRLLHILHSSFPAEAQDKIYVEICDRLNIGKERWEESTDLAATYNSFIIRIRTPCYFEVKTLLVYVLAWANKKQWWKFP
jgi:hypothetical protein